MLKLCLKKKKKSEKEKTKKGGSKCTGRNTAEGWLEAGPRFPEAELGLFLVGMRKACCFIFLELRTVLLEFKRKTRQTSWKSQYQPGGEGNGVEEERPLSQARGQLAACTGGGRESFQGRMGKPKVSEKDCLGSGRSPKEKMKTWTKEKSGFSD